MWCGIYYVYVDSSNRIAATSRLSDHLLEEDKDQTYTLHQEVDLFIATRSEMGYRAVINGTHLGLIHNKDIFQKLNLGQSLKGYIKSIREDGRINLTLQSTAPEKRMDLRNDLASQILDHLELHGGKSPITDKSPPEDIYAQYQVSKSNYKKALGKLYKEKKIAIEKDHIRLA